MTGAEALYKGCVLTREYMEIWTALAPRSVDTLNTITRKQTAFANCHNKTSFKPRMFPCVNMQKETSGGISGVMTEIDATDTLMGLDCATENIFGGISMVRCDVSKTKLREISADKHRLLAEISQDLQGPELDTPLSQLMPNGAEHDFYWDHQVCEMKEGLALKGAILQDGRAHQVNLYDAYKCVTQRSKDLGSDQVDVCIRDGTPWKSSLHGSIGLYEHTLGDSPGLYLVCVGSLPYLGSEVFR